MEQQNKIVLAYLKSIANKNGDVTITDEQLALQTQIHLRTLKRYIQQLKEEKLIACKTYRKKVTEKQWFNHRVITIRPGFSKEYKNIICDMLAHDLMQYNQRGVCEAGAEAYAWFDSIPVEYFLNIDWKTKPPVSIGMDMIVAFPYDPVTRKIVNVSN